MVSYTLKDIKMLAKNFRFEQLEAMLQHSMGPMMRIDLSIELAIALIYNRIYELERIINANSERRTEDGTRTLDQTGNALSVGEAEKPTTKDTVPR